MCLHYGAKFGAKFVLIHQSYIAVTLTFEPPARERAPEFGLLQKWLLTQGRRESYFNFLGAAGT
jgi:hypothetical protein